MTEFLSPRPIAAGDKLSEFNSGEEALDRWLRGRARGNEKSGASRTMICVTDSGIVAGYYCLSSSALTVSDGPAKLVQGQPDPVPVVLLGRLAVDRQFAGRGLGFSLLRHAVLRAIEASETLGIRAMLVHALTDEVVPFYEKFGFTRFPGQSHTLYLLIADARETITRAP